MDCTYHHRERRVWEFLVLSAADNFWKFVVSFHIYINFQQKLGVDIFFCWLYRRVLYMLESWSTFSTPKMPLTKMDITRPTQGQLRHGTLRYVAKSNREIGFSQFLFSFSPWKLLPPRKLCASKSFEGGALFSTPLILRPISRATEVDGRRTAYRQNR